MTEPDAIPDYSGKRFLVVDDVPYMQDLVSNMLKRCGSVEVVKASSVELGLRHLGAEKIDCVISDFNMKPVNGLQFLFEVRAGLRLSIQRSQRFILVTGHAEIDVVKVAKKLDVHGYVVKPVSLNALMKALERAFSVNIALKDMETYRSVVLPVGY